MTIPEAIKRMKQRVAGDFSDGDPNDLTDMELAIQAMERIRWMRETPGSHDITFLADETAK